MKSSLSRSVSNGVTGFDGDRPINTNGGRSGFGHTYVASGLADIGERHFATVFYK